MTRDTQLRSDANARALAESPPEAGVTAERYVEIEKIARLLRAETTACDLEPSNVAKATLFLEARLLDGRRYRDWLGLLTPDYVYWIPGSDDIHDPRLESAVNFDDHRRMIDRIVLIETGELHAQTPPSRACRVISNVEAWLHGEDRMLVRSNLVIWEFRRGTTTTFVGSQFHELVETADSWGIRTRIIKLLDCDEPQGNVTFIL